MIYQWENDSQKTFRLPLTNRIGCYLANATKCWTPTNGRVRSEIIRERTGMNDASSAVWFGVWRLTCRGPTRQQQPYHQCVSFFLLRRHKKNDDEERTTSTRLLGSPVAALGSVGVSAELIRDLLLTVPAFSSALFDTRILCCACGTFECLGGREKDITLSSVAQ